MSISFLVFALCLAVNLSADLVVPHFYADYTSGNFYLYTLASILFFVFSSIEMPLLYSMGYAKVRVFQYLIYISLALFFTKVVGENKMKMFLIDTGINTSLMLSMVITSIIVWFFSMMISARIYVRKDI